MVHADDVTELRESEERLRAVIATVESGLLTVDLLGRITDANPAACKLLGMSRARLSSDPRWWESLKLRYEDGTALVPGAPETPGTRAMRARRGRARRQGAGHTPRGRRRRTSRPTTSRSATEPRSEGSCSRSWT